VGKATIKMRVLKLTYKHITLRFINVLQLRERMKELNIEPRDYQENILKTCQKESCLVVLPTGTGKTLIATMLTVDRFKKFPLQKIVILAPTRPLIEQHFESFSKLLPEGWADMQLFTGKTQAEKREKIWQTAEFIFSTPQCIANDLKKNLYDLNDVSLLVVDECHRCLKNYAYNYVAQRYKNLSENHHVLGLTASPGSDKRTITEVCKNLGISAVEIRTRESPDVKPYLQELEFEKIEVDFPPELIEIRGLLEEIYNKKVQELKNRRVLFGYASKTQLLRTQAKLMKGIRRGKNMNKMIAVSVCAQAIKISHAMELLETQTISSFIIYLKDLFQQAAEQKSKGVQKLVKDPLFGRAYTLATTLSFEHPKLEKLKEIIRIQFLKDPNSKVIIFAQFRETVREITKTISGISGVRTDLFVGQAIKKHNKGTTGLKQKEQKEMLEKFKRGEINVLAATSIAEEGLDIPEVSEVIFYEPVPSAIRKIQRTGRTARLAPGSLKILITKKTRDEIYHYVAQNKERKMHKAIDEIKNTLEEKQKELFK
jgi:ERCC4-related helicase